MKATNQADFKGDYGESNHPRIFVDKLGTVASNSGVLRIDFQEIRVRMTPPSQEATRYDKTVMSVAMPVHAAVEMIEMLHNFISAQQLAEATAPEKNN